jgi:hypothetical protein
MTNWKETIGTTNNDLLPGASAATVAALEVQLGTTLPSAYKEFLQYADGGFLNKRTILLFSAGKGLHPSETLAAANRSLPADHPLLIIGRTAEEDFGFKKGDLTFPAPPVFLYRHETRKLAKLADSFREFLNHLPPAQ